VKVTIATSIKYGNYKHLQSRANRLVRFIESWRNEIKEYVDFDEGVEINIRPIRGKDATGRALLDANKVELDPRFTLRQQCKSIIHELIHNEQVKHSRLELGEKWKWNGKSCNKPNTHQEYLNLPWEVEARIRTKEIYPKVFH
tara:strand:- start:869 stop:1297 length:429 start_codon:yes stop_codon:yes gene_type:complete